VAPRGRRLPAGDDCEPRDVTIFALFRHVFAGSRAAGARVEAFDALGTRVL
jgi:hypothetical protein